VTALHSGAVVLRYKGKKLLGVLNRPALTGRRRCPAVLVLHGFPGAEKNVDVQRRLLSLGVASFSLYFAGAWGSEGEYTFSGLVPQAQAGLRYLAGLEFVDAGRLGVFGFSMGGWTALNLAALRPDLRGAVAVAPVGGAELISSRTPVFIRRHALPLRVSSAAALTRDFRNALTERDPYEAAARLKCPLLLVHGGADDVVPASVSKKLYALARAPKKLVIAKGAVHDFLDRRDWLARLSAGWLARRLRA
jgi:dipeptidyl aminopeptidase/acylaminoacyl peptidase